TDELGYNAIEDPVDVHDLHATLLYLMGIEHTKLTYRFQGRDFRLTDVSGNVVKKLLAWEPGVTPGFWSGTSRSCASLLWHTGSGRPSSSRRTTGGKPSPATKSSWRTAERSASMCPKNGSSFPAPSRFSSTTGSLRTTIAGSRSR